MSTSEERNVITRSFCAICLIVLGIVANGCVSIRQGAIDAANSALPTLVQEYRNQEMACVSASKTKQEAENCVAGVRASWAPVFKAWDYVKTADDSVGAFCNLLETAKSVGVILPDVDKVCVAWTPSS